ncbi:hypothetical protein L1987_59543 [Smallanthus sonchifolius]|uniref:Uncharacterized protein n=1 Tax=Smallanthus sonchifolius TaxID=185202 RepID=A0ACB9D5S8_9ASTR|nr:hypothetical protein L1987_59543 [Smallanthus sonchifolius]
MMGALSTQKLTRDECQEEKVQVKEEPQDEKTGSVDQISKKYGFSSTGIDERLYFASANGCMTSSSLKVVTRVWSMMR